MADDAPIDLGDPASVKERTKSIREREADEDAVIKVLMASKPGRSFVYGVLEFCHVYATSFRMNALEMSKNEGERNVGLMLTARLVRVCPEFYLKMLEEGKDNG